MRLNRFFLVLFFVCLALLVSSLSYSQDLSYEYLLNLGKKEFAEENYGEALHYFKLAQLVNPTAEEVNHYINLIKRIKEGRVITEREISNLEEAVERKKKRERLKTEFKETERETTYTFGLKKEPKYQPEKEPLKRETKIKKALESWQKKEEPSRQKETIAYPQKEISKGRTEQTIDLALAIDEDFPLNLQISRYNSFLITSGEIKNYLVISPNVVSIQKIDQSTLKITAERTGSTFIHIWDNQQRWTLNLNVTRERMYTEQDIGWEKPEGFDFSYAIDWDTYYRGDTFDKMERESLNVTHWAGINGPTPYGDLYGYVHWEKLGDTNEVTGYGVSLTEGKFWDFRDFSIHGFDFNKYFSPLSFPGMTLKGVAFESPAFSNRLKYTILYGRERETYYRYISPGLGFTEEKDSFIKAYRMTLFPYGNHKFSFNYAEAYGRDRADYLKEKVYSLDTEHTINDDLTIYTETATDQDKVAGTISSTLTTPTTDLTLSFRDIEKDFVTITGRPPNRGEIGGMLDFEWRASDDFTASTNLDVYRERFLPNPGEPDKLNFDWNNSLFLQLTPTSNLRSYINYSYVPGIISPYRTLNTNLYYNKQFELNFLSGRYLTTYLGHSFQRSVNPLSPASDYKRHSLLTGIRIELISDLYTYCDYTYSWVEELYTNSKSNPSVFTSGLDYFHSVNPSLSSNIRVNYRNEENTTATHSFLSGEDSLEGSLNISYYPTKNTELFLDSRVRNVWAEDPTAEEYIEADIRLGARLTWENFFQWAAKTKIYGSVFRDKNGNQIKDKGEEGIKDIPINIGPKEAVTDKDGNYSTTVRAKNVVVSIDLSKVPSKYVLTTTGSQKLDVSKGGKEEINFGLSSQSSIYGVIYHDVNANNKLDEQDIPIPNTKLSLDQTRETKTNSEGVYYFGNLNPGKHTVRLDINSLPIEYIPKTTVIKEIEVPQGHTYNYHIPLGKK